MKYGRILLNQKLSDFPTSILGWRCIAIGRLGSRIDFWRVDEGTLFPRVRIQQRRKKGFFGVWHSEG